MKYQEAYQLLKEKYSQEEIVESAFVPADLTAKEAKQLSDEMRKIRMQKLQETTEEDRILADVMRLRFQIEHYVKKEQFSFEKTFGKFLAEYLRILKKSRREIAADLSLHYTKLSRIINEREEPNIGLTYRLEKHSGNLIKAEIWWKLLVKKQEFVIARDEQTRALEQQKVKNFLRA